MWGLGHGTNQRSPDRLGDRDDDGVSKGSAGSAGATAQPAGNPIIHSRKRIEVPATALRPSPLVGDAPRLFQSPETVGVGNRAAFKMFLSDGRLRCPDRPAEPPWLLP